LEKSKDAFRTISEVSELIELPSHVLRFWESKFKYIKPLKRGGGRRYYRPDDISLLFGIKHLLYDKGLTIRGSLKVIQTKGVKFVTKIGADNKINNQKREKNNLSEFNFFSQYKNAYLKDNVKNNLTELLSKLEEIKSKIEKRVSSDREVIL
tara:strand:- start:328 stop:783 length:456 start_codon:yes stop_codon:yes gene_type:complete